MNTKAVKSIFISLKTQDKKIVLLKYIIYALLLFIILTAIYTSFMMNLGDRSLWLDEAMLAYSFTKRSLDNLTSDILEWIQSAPVLYLYIVKIITIIFGNTEFILRIWSFISFIFLLSFSYYILKKVLNTRYPLIGVALMSNMAILFRYSNEFKPYMCDCSVVLFVIILYYLYHEKKVSKCIFCFSFVPIIWLSNPGCFFIASVLLIEFTDSLIKKNFSQMRFVTILGIIIFISFILHYFHWLNPVMDAGEMAEYWKNKNFSLIPTDYSHIEKQKTLIQELFIYFGYYKYLIFIIVSLGFFINLCIERNRFVNVIYGGIIITLFASILGVYPVQDKLYLFLYPLLAILFFFFLGKSFSDNLVSNIVILAISFVILFSLNGILYYRNFENIYINNEETNQAIDSTGNNIKKNDKLHLYFSSVPRFCYKNKYDTISLAPFEHNVILGKGFFSGGKNRNDIKLITNEDSVYILASHSNGFASEKIVPLVDSLKTMDIWN
ncbi:MAG: glycosyltransferase family 39 protein [Prevotella sp.]|nr:glycosyltransferase family 39 protein [Prevotella sp.]